MADMTGLITGVDTSRSRRNPKIGYSGQDPYADQGTGTARVQATSSIDPNAPTPTVIPQDPSLVASMQSDFLKRQAQRRRNAMIGQGLNGAGNSLLSNPAITRKTLLGA